ncbi:hypothetical protein [Nocardiopsis ansamitocini]|uniref:Uncharacterized protein n=1 Tax=Nocardiopsis ansamitocini TaxID=1670832 RepID=A0A9W6P400_9ACTN|nr:hypothetical protein [Nocardiopsis ansamitocini]GLU46657.1 hypothetical protein Nans01_10080 [Nocardiopsis ansamitocini]
MSRSISRARRGPAGAAAQIAMAMAMAIWAAALGPAMADNRAETTADARGRTAVSAVDPAADGETDRPTGTGTRAGHPVFSGKPPGATSAPRSTVRSAASPRSVAGTWLGTVLAAGAGLLVLGAAVMLLTRGGGRDEE